MIDLDLDRYAEIWAEAGAFINSRAFDGVTGDSWTMLAALDYLVINNKVKLVSQKGMTQNWVYTQ